MFSRKVLCACLAPTFGFLASQDVSAQLNNPISQPITKQGIRVEIEDVVQMPSTQFTLGSKPDKAPNSVARINFLRESPDGRLFVNDLRGQLYRLDSNLQPQLYLDIDSANGGAGSIFPATWFANGLAAGFVSFTFHPEFESNGLFYTIHAEQGSSTSAVPHLQTTDLADPSAPVTWHTVITEWAAADPLQDAWNESTGSRREILRVGTTASAYFHPFGDLQFNPNSESGDADYGLLYVSGGDWGYINGAGAPQDPDTEGQPGQLQRLDSLASSFIRIDPRPVSVTGGQAGLGEYTIPADNPFVDGDPNTLDEIYAFGLRNGHRMAWDEDNTIFVSSVGHDNIEEVERIIPGGNYAWGNREGTFVNGNDLANGGNGDADDVFANNVPDVLDVDFRGEEYLYPVAQYDHGEGNAIAGGFVYRGSLIPELYGKFIFGDIVNGRIFAADVDEMKSIDLTDPATTAAIEEVQLFVRDGSGGETDVNLRGDFLPSRVDLRFGMDNDGEIWILTKEDGFIRRLVSSFDAVWDVDGGGVWNTGTNWEAGSVPTAGDSVLFGASLSAPNSPALVDLNTNVSVSFLSFSNEYSYELTGTGTLTLVGAARISNSTGNHTLVVTIAGTSGLSKEGTATLTLTQANTYSGDTTITDGTLALAGTGSIGGSTHIHVQAAGRLDVSAVSAGAYALVNQTLTIDGDVTGNLIASSGSVVHINSVNSLDGGLVLQGGSLADGAGRVTGSVQVMDGTLRVGGDGLGTPSTQAQVDDFESYSTGLVRDVASPPWTAHDNSSSVAIQQEAGGNNYLTIGDTSNFRAASRDLPAAMQVQNDEVATLFFRFNSQTDAPNSSFGLGDQATNNGAQFSDYEAQLRLIQGPAAGQIEINARNGGSFTGLLATVADDTWYNVWMVVDQTSDTYDLYMNTGLADADNTNLIASGLNFRNGTSASLSSLLAMAGPANLNYAVRYDDVYFGSGSDLSNPLGGLVLSGFESNTLLVEGDVSMGDASMLEVDIATTTAYDTLDVGGTLVANGALRVMLVASASSPQLGDRFDVLNFATIEGSFDSLELPSLDAGLFWNPVTLYTTGELTVVDFDHIDGDTDGDGDVDDSDFGTSFANFTGPVGAVGGKTLAQGDADGDGDIDDSDFGIAFANFTGPLSSAVPEPSSLILFGAGCLASLRSTRNRGQPL